MKIAVLGSGSVGVTIATKLVKLGHEVMIGTRVATNEKATEWAKSTGKGASNGAFADAIRFGDMIFNCVLGAVAVDVLSSAGVSAVDGKIVVDVSNPLDFSNGMPPSLFVGNTDSLGETIQRALPSAKIVKSLNTITASVMVDPSSISGDHDVFVCGNDAEAKTQVTKMLKDEFGWKSVVDLGDITGARMSEALVLFWVRLYMLTGSPMHNIKVVR